MDALQLLHNDHDTVRELFAQFRRAEEAEDTEQMIQTKEKIFQELQVHTAIEEEVFYPAGKEVGGEAEELVREGVEEHHVVEVLMGEIASLDPSDEQWTAKMTVLIENVEHHAEEEEEELFPKLREAFGDERLGDMGAKLEEAKQRHQASAGGGTEASKDELYEKAREQGVKGRSGMSKDELAEAVGEE